MGFGCGVWGLGCGVLGVGCTVRKWGLSKWGLRGGVWGLGLGIRGVLHQSLGIRSGRRHTPAVCSGCL
jgi:hypothetical protein